jgi:hypothetical protein
MSGSNVLITTQDFTLFGPHTYQVQATVPTSTYLTGSSSAMLMQINFTTLSCQSAIMSA